MVIEWGPSNTSSRRRADLVEQFEKHGLPEEFEALHWARGNTPAGEAKRRRHLRIKKQSEEFLAGGGPEVGGEEKGVIMHSKQRRVERLNAPRHCRGVWQGTKAVSLLDLSPEGARIEHGEPLRNWSSVPMDLPRALGGGQVRAEVVWSRALGHKPAVEGKPKFVYQSGLAFPHCTPEEKAALSVALVRLAGEWALGMLRDLRRQAEHDPAHQERFDALCGESLRWFRREIVALRFTKKH